VRSLLRLKSYTDELDRAESVLFALARSIEARDPYTGGHCERLATFGRALGQRLGLSESDLVAIERAGTVHDIGKIAIPDRILLKAGPLDDDEWTVMRQHTVTGEQICAPVRSFREVLPIIRSHHERLDGSGYPDGLVGEQIPVTARILQAVDVFDALTTERPYKKAMSVERALAVLREEMTRGWWDRDVVKTFERLLEERDDLRRLVPRTNGSGRGAGA
jgi:putative two-component system response regulator